MRRDRKSVIVAIATTINVGHHANECISLLLSLRGNTHPAAINDPKIQNLEHQLHTSIAFR